jgi:magnesium-transporting ATPase (P-type)
MSPALLTYLAHLMRQLTLLATDKTGTLTRNQMTVHTQRLDVNSEGSLV